MANHPYKTGDRWRCFVIVREDRGWGGPYGQSRKPAVWRCEVCGYEIPDHTDTFRGRVRRDAWAMQRLADHHECGHAPCEYCGKMLLRRKDGTPRQHQSNVCPAKSDGHKIEREFVKNMARREFV